jgi:molybdopterin-guanine dinucleotide biosynthesis protein A
MPIEALREVFGRSVATVGACDPKVAELGDMIIPDPYPGVGPVGGILASLEFATASVFVLAGDLPSISANAVRTLLSAANRNPIAWAILARTDEIQPCIGIYRLAALETLRVTMLAGRPLREALPRVTITTVALDAAYTRNINRPADLPPSSQ